MAGVWSVVIRFACHLPLGIVGFTGRDLYEKVNDFESTGIYDVIPHGREFLYGLAMYEHWVSSMLRTTHSGDNITE